MALYNSRRVEEEKFIRNMRAGESLGERGIIKRLTRSLTVVASTDVALISVTAKDFKKVMLFKSKELLDAKIIYIKKYIPKTQMLARTHLEKIAYSMHYFKHPLGATLIKANETSNYLYFIISGECILKNATWSTLITGGGILGEEGVFYEQKSPFNATVASDFLEVYMLGKHEIMLLCSSKI